MEEPNERLQRARRDAGYEDATFAARRFGWNENTYRSHENGTRGVRRDSAERYAKAFKVGIAWLLTGEGAKQTTGIRLVGHVGADARPDVVIFTDVQGDLDDDVPIPPDRKATTVAVVVKGNSMRSIARDGWLIYYNESDIKVGPRSFQGLYGELCICWLVDGRVLFKELHPGRRPDLSYLMSTNDDPLPDVMVERAVRVTFIAPRGPRPKSDQLAVAHDAPIAERKA